MSFIHILTDAWNKLSCNYYSSENVAEPTPTDKIIRRIYEENVVSESPLLPTFVPGQLHRSPEMDFSKIKKADGGFAT